MKVDLHTHSVASPDGSLTEESYRKMLDTGRLDFIAVTDHNTLSYAQQLREKIGNQIIVGEEITTLDGEIIGLYLETVIRPGMSAVETVAEIKKQGGLVYIPHPFETLRKALSLDILNAIAKDVDIVETHNGRAFFQNKTRDVEAWAFEHHLPGAASSDAHGWHGWGGTHTIVDQALTRANLLTQLSQATYKVTRPGLRSLLYPKLNRIRRRRRA
jgi:predicted metal-dependent phosphoesterase TrpH